jgi:hypothetical protein
MHSETRINSIILYFLTGRQEHYSETALSEAHYSEGYLYLYLHYLKENLTKTLQHATERNVAPMLATTSATVDMATKWRHNEEAK